MPHSFARVNTKGTALSIRDVRNYRIWGKCDSYC